MAKARETVEINDIQDSAGTSDHKARTPSYTYEVGGELFSKLLICRLCSLGFPNGSLCKDEFATMSELEAHYENYHFMIPCDWCNLILPNREILNSHIRKHHQEESDTIKVSEALIEF